MVIGLAAAGRDPAAVRRDGHTPVGWIRSHLGQLQGAGDLERTILALAAAPAPLGDLLARLRGDLRGDGSVAEQANLTSFAILALRAAGARRQRARRGLAGARSRTATAGSASRRVATQAMSTTRRRRSRRSLRRRRGTPWWRAPRASSRPTRTATAASRSEPGGASNSQSTAWAVQALVAAGDATKRPIAYLRARVGGSGAVQYAAGVEQTPVWVTAQALAALARVPLPVRSPVLSAARGTRQGPKRAWRSGCRSGAAG